MLGDYCTDIYRYGNCKRISPEAPVPILDFEFETECAGMAGNVYNNLNALHVNSEIIFDDSKCLKIRYVDLKTKQHITRIDYNAKSKPLSIDLKNLNNYSGVIISDYDKGSIDKHLIESILASYNGPVFVDSKKQDLSIFDSCIIKINASEFEKAVNIPKTSELIVTLGDRGACYNGEYFPTEKAATFDVSGAGDTFIAALAVQYCLNSNIRDAIKFANICAASVVRKSGTSTLEYSEVSNALCF